MCNRSISCLLALLGFSIGGPAFGETPATSGDPQPAASSAPGAATTVIACNELGLAFGLGIDGARAERILARSCRRFAVSAGSHLFAPRGRPDMGPWFTDPAWQIEVPAEGAVLRFGLRGELVTLLEVRAGLPSPTASDAPAEEAPIYLGPASEFAPRDLSPWTLCAPMDGSRVLVDGAYAFGLTPGACGLALLPFGWHTLTYLTPYGAWYAPPYVSMAGPGGGAWTGRPGGVGRVPPRWSGMLPPFTAPRHVSGRFGRRPVLVPAPKSARALTRNEAVAAHRAAVASRMNRGRQVWPSNGRAWANHRARQNGWVIGPRGERAWRSPFEARAAQQRAWAAWRGGQRGTPYVTPSRPYRPAPVYRPGYGASQRPAYRPMYRPGHRPTYRPMYRPTYRPPYRSSYSPSYRPSYSPSYRPSYRPSYQPSYRPSYRSAPSSPSRSYGSSFRGSSGARGRR